jgi:hypothetical protein
MYRLVSFRPSIHKHQIFNELSLQKAAKSLAKELRSLAEYHIVAVQRTKSIGFYL